MRYLQHLDSRHQNLKDTTTEVVRQHDIWVNHKEFRNEHLHQLPLCIEQLYIRRIVLFELLHQVERPGVTRKTSHQTKSLNLSIIVRWSILIDLSLNQARDHGNLIGVFSRSGSLDAEREAGQGWRGPV